MKNQLNRELITGLDESSNDEFLTRTNDLVYDIVASAVSDISFKSPFVRLDKCSLIPANEIVTGAVSQLSEYTYFLGVDNTQIELNSKNKKHFWKFIWREFRASWRISNKKKYKKQKKNTNPNEIQIKEIEKYGIGDFKHDLMLKVADYLQESSIVYEFPRYISLIGNEDFGTNVKVNIFVCSYDSKRNVYKLFKENRNKFFEVDFGKRLENIEAKIKSCGGAYLSMMRIFNALYSKSYNKIPNQILLESLIYNCPDALFNNEDVYKTFINVANFIRMTIPQKFVSICDETKKIFDEPLIIESSSQIDFGKIINMLDRFQY